MLILSSIEVFVTFANLLSNHKIRGYFWRLIYSVHYFLSSVDKMLRKILTITLLLEFVNLFGKRFPCVNIL